MKLINTYRLLALHKGCTKLSSVHWFLICELSNENVGNLSWKSADIISPEKKFFKLSNRDTSLMFTQTRHRKSFLK